MGRLLAGVVLVLVQAAPAAAQAPLPVVERTTHHGEISTRTSLFSNQVVVVTISSGGEQSFMRMLSLPEDQYLIYLGILEEATSELGERPVSSAVSTSRDRVDLVLHLGPEAPRTLDFSPMATVSLPLARIMGAVDDLERLTKASSPSAEELRTWQPRRGDRVELMTGGFAKVAEIHEGEVLVLEHEATFVRQVVPPDARDDVILHVLERGP